MNPKMKIDLPDTVFIAIMLTQDDDGKISYAGRFRQYQKWIFTLVSRVFIASIYASFWLFKIRLFLNRRKHND